MSRHLTESSRRSWATIASMLVARLASGIGGWLTMAIVAVLPATVVRWLWLIALAEPFGDEVMATLSANVASGVTWLGVVIGVRRLVRRNPLIGRHQRRVRQRVANLSGHRQDM